jgi:hypothetical protein
MMTNGNNAQAPADDAYKPVQFTLVIDYVPGQGWEAAFEGDQPTLGTGGSGWEASDPAALLRAVIPALRQYHRSPWELFTATYSRAVNSALAWFAGYMRGNAAEVQAGYDQIKDDAEARARQDQSMMTTSGLFHSARMFTEAADQADATLAAYKALPSGDVPGALDYFDMRHGHVLTNALMVQSEHLRKDGAADDAAQAGVADAARREWERLTGELDEDEPLDAGVQD